MNSKVEAVHAKKSTFFAGAKAKLIRDLRVAQSIFLEDRLALAEAAEEIAEQKTDRLRKKLAKVINSIAETDSREYHAKRNRL